MNASNLSLNSEEGELFNKLGKISIITAYSVVATIGIPGNLFILIILSNKKNRRNSCDTFVMSLALCDFLASVFIPFIMINDLVLPDWKFGSVACKILPSFNVMSLFASAWSLVIISIDRMRVVYCPFRKRLSKNFKLLLIGIVWISATAATYPYASVLKLDVSGHVCWDDWDETSEFRYFIVIAILVCFCPITIMTCCYACAWRKIQTTSVFLNTCPARARRHKQNKRALTMFIAIVSVFSILITPYFILVIILHTVQLYFLDFFYTYQRILYELNYGLFTLAAFNSCINCFIYARMHSTIGKRLLSKRSFDSGTIILQRTSGKEKSRSDKLKQELLKRQPTHY